MNKKAIIAITIIVVALLGCVVYLALNLQKQQQENKDMQELAALDKAEMENEYQRFADQ